MAYDDVDHVLSPAQSPVFGPVSLVMLGGALGIGLAGVVFALVLGLNSFVGFALGMALGLALTFPIRGVAVWQRSVLVARYAARRGTVIDVGTVDAADLITPIIRISKNGRPLIRRVEP